MSRRARAAVIAAGVAALAVAAAAVAVVATGGDDAERADRRAPAPVPRPGRTLPAAPAAVEEIRVGRGVRSAIVVRPRPARPAAPVVVFLHGWTAVDPAPYAPWLRHLVAGGATVVYPAYQQVPFLDVRTPLRNVRAALRTALARIGRHGPLVAAGHSAGGALAADLAASARRTGLPVPRAVYAVYPGRALRGFALRLAGPPLSRIPAPVRILALASPTDEVVGTATARAIVRGARRVPENRRTLRIIRAPAVGDHLAPQRDGARERRTFWRPLDGLVRVAQARASGSSPSQVPAAP
jgi:acetyl esterase/lipase